MKMNKLDDGPVMDYFNITIDKTKWLWRCAMTLLQLQYFRNLAHTLHELKENQSGRDMPVERHCCCRKTRWGRGGQIFNFFHEDWFENWA